MLIACGLAKEAFIKNCLRLYGKIDPTACTQKVIFARAKFLYRAGKLVQAYPQTQLVQMKKLNEIEVNLAQDLMGAKAFVVAPHVLHTAPEMIETIQEQPCSQMYVTRLSCTYLCTMPKHICM